MDEYLRRWVLAFVAVWLVITVLIARGSGSEFAGWFFLAGMIHGPGVALVYSYGPALWRRLPWVRRRRQVKDQLDLIESGRRLASERESLIAAGVDPADLAIPLAPKDRP